MGPATYCETHTPNNITLRLVVIMLWQRMLPDLVDVELFHEVEVSAFPAQMSLGHGFDALLLQTVHHVVVGVLVWEACQSLKYNHIQ